jgi:hypothetical protein
MASLDPSRPGWAYRFDKGHRKQYHSESSFMTWIRVAGGAGGPTDSPTIRRLREESAGFVPITGGMTTSETDPHGFNDMTTRQLTDWLGGGNAEPGSITYQHAQAVLEAKLAEGGSQGVHHQLHIEDEVKMSDEMARPSVNRGVTPERLAAAGFIIGPSLAVGAATRSLLIGLAVFAFLVLIFAVPQTRHWLMEGIHRLTGT